MTARRTRLHSAAAKPAVWAFSILYLMGVAAMSHVLWRPREDRVLAVATGAMALLGGVMIWKLWRLPQVVYLTQAGIEVSKERRVIPWDRVRDLFRLSMNGSVMPICCIVVKDREDWEIHFLGRFDFDRVVDRFKSSRLELTDEANRSKGG